MLAFSAMSRCSACSTSGRRRSTSDDTSPGSASRVVGSLPKALGSCSAGTVVPTSRLSAFWSRARSEEHTSELQSLMRISYAGFCLKKKKIKEQNEYEEYR